MMEYSEGSRSSGICPRCKHMVITRMQWRDYPPVVLVAICQECGDIVAIPHQSTAAINAAKFPAPDPPRAERAMIDEDTTYVYEHKDNSRYHWRIVFIYSGSRVCSGPGDPELKESGWTYAVEEQRYVDYETVYRGTIWTQEGEWPRAAEIMKEIAIEAMHLAVGFASERNREPKKFQEPFQF